MLCSKYWDHADELPISEIVTYWCEKSGHNLQKCKDAKRSAILAACEKGLLEYSRTDLKTFDDPVRDLESRGLLLINRKSFDSWVIENFENESPLPKQTLTTTEKNKLLAIILGMAMDKYGYDPDATRNAATGDNNVGISAALQRYEGLSVDTDTIRKYLAEASKLCQKKGKKKAKDNSPDDDEWTGIAPF